MNFSALLEALCDAVNRDVDVFVGIATAAPAEEIHQFLTDSLIAEAGLFTAQDFGGFSFMSKGGSYLAPYNKFETKLPADVKEMVAKRKAEILAGTFRVDIDESIPKSN